MKKIKKIISLTREWSLFTPLVIIAFIFIFVFGSSLMILDRQYISIESLFEEASTGYINQTEEVIKTWMETKIKVVKFIADDKRIIATCEDPTNLEKREKAKDYLNSINNVYSEIELIPIVTTSKTPFLIKKTTPSGSQLDSIVRKGDAFISSKDDNIVGEIGLEYSFVSEILKGSNLYISDAYHSIYNRNPIIAISAPIKNDNKTIGVAIVSVKLNSFTDEFITDSRVIKSGYMFIVDERKMTVAHPEKKHILVKTEYEKDIQETINRIVSGETFIKGKYKGEKRIYTSKKMNLSKYMENDWFIISSIDEKDLYAGVGNLKIILGIMSMSVIAVTASALFIVFRINNESTLKKTLQDTNEQLQEKIIERRKALEEKVKRDSLTGLYNHNTFFRILEDEFKNSINSEARLCLIMLDIDWFKDVNDVYGHIVGDEVLIKLARVLRANTRGDDIVGRYGGEEFIILLKNTSFDDAVNKAEELRRNIEDTSFSVENLKVTASFGVSIWDGHQSIAEIAKSVDDKLYVAKRTGRNKVVSTD